jgi:hypothetical protein
VRQTPHPASLAIPEKAEQPPSNKREMGWRGEFMNPKIFIRSDRKEENAPGKLW